MSQGRSIRLFLVDGSPTGLLTAEIMNWTGHVLTGPRSLMKEIVGRPECARTGIYFLVGPDPENSLLPLIYIGESDDVARRLTQHNRPEEQGGKDFWERVCLITSKDQNLTKAHVKYLEAQLIKVATDAGRCQLVNGTSHAYAGLPESDRADMAFFVEQIRTVLPVLGLDILRELQKSSMSEAAVTQEAVSRSPYFVLKRPQLGITARGQEIDGEFVVLKGSLASFKWGNTEGSYGNLFRQLVDKGVLVSNGGGHRQFSDDYAFSSPSAAAAVISGRNANGRTAWKVEETGQSYGEWQEQLVDSVVPVNAEG
jgi:hypothetical protein